MAERLGGTSGEVEGAGDSEADSEGKGEDEGVWGGCFFQMKGENTVFVVIHTLIIYRIIFISIPTKGFVQYMNTRAMNNKLSIDIEETRTNPLSC